MNDLQRRPQIAQQLSDLLGMTVTEFLLFTQTYTVPYLVLTKKREILQKVADSCNRSPKTLCMDHNNLAAILACMLLQASDDIESMIMALFGIVSPEFNKIDYSELLKAEQPLTASELLKAAGEDDDKRQKVSKAQPSNLALTLIRRHIKPLSFLPTSHMGGKDLLGAQHARPTL